MSDGDVLPAPRGPDDAHLPRDTRRSLPMALLRAREQVMARFRPMLAENGINEQQWRVLRVLDEGGALDASEVAMRANILSPSLTRMIRAMTDRGLIRRGRDQSDARRVILELASEGAALIARVSPQGQRIYRGLTAEFGEDRLISLLTLLDELAHLPTPDQD
jgi:homoprotocatechuate degradation regulator HpaR